MTHYAYTDGASRGNPGDSGIGLLVRDETGVAVLTLHGYIGKTTNNIAEYTALIALLKKMKDAPRCSRLIVHSDSELMVRQLNGEYRVKDAGLKKYHAKVSRLLSGLHCPVEIRYIPREENREADRLANLAINTKKKIRI